MIEFFKQPPVIGAIIVVVGAAIIAPLVKKFYFDVQNRLRVEVRAWNYRTSEAMKKAVSEFPLFSPTRKFAKAGGYMTVTITNISKKKISGVSVTVPNSDIDMVLQIDDAEDFIEIKRGRAITIGDIQPKHFRVMHIWSNVDTSDFDFAWFKRFLELSADELDSVRLRFPMPRYLWKKHELRLVWTWNLVFFSVIFLSLYLGFIR